MNKFPSILLLAVAIGAGAFAIYESQRAERYRALAAQTERAAAGAREAADLHTSEIRQLKEQSHSQKAAIEQLETRNRELASGGPAAAAKRAATNVAAAERSATDGEAGKDEREAGTAEGGGFMKGFAKMFADPKMKEAMRAQQAAGVNMMYADLAREIGLAPDEARQVFALLADRQMDMVGKSMAAMGKDGLDEKALAAVGKDAEAAKAGYDEQLKAVLGKERYAKFQEYETTIGERATLDQIQKQLAAGGTPLEAGQTKGLLQIMKEERAKAPNPAPTANPSAQMKIMQSEEGVNTYLKMQEDFNRRVLERARTVLSPDQILTFETAQKQLIEMQRMGVQMSREMFKGGGNK